MDKDTQLQALTEAWNILREARKQVAPLAAMRPYAYLDHAASYISQQADRLLQPVFADAEW